MRWAPVDDDVPSRAVYGDAQGEEARVQSRQDFAQLQERFRDPMQQRYELIRPLVLFQDRTATERAEETGTHPETVRRLKRRFEQQGLLGLVPDAIEVVPAGRRRRVPETVVQELTIAIHQRPED